MKTQSGYTGKINWMFRLAAAVIMLVLLVGLGSVNSYAEATASGECGENVTWSIDGNVLTISGEGGINSYSLNQTPPWSSYADQVKEIVIEEGVTSIGSRAFRFMSAVENVSFPESLTEIGISAFYECTGLKSVTFSPSITSIRDGAFSACSGLETVIIDTTASINYDGVFSYNAGISNIHVTKDAVISWSSLKALADSGTVDLEAGRTDYASEGGVLFDPDKTKLLYYPRMSTATSYTVPDTVVSIEMEAFKEVWYLESVDLGNVESLAYGAFYGANALREVHLPDTLKTADTFAFGNIKSTLQILEINSDVEMQPLAFANDLVDTLVLGDSVTKYPAAMQNIKKIQNFSISAANAHFKVADNVLFSKDGSKIFAYPAVSTECSYTIPSNVTKIEGYAFSNNMGSRPKLTVTLPDDLMLEEVGDYAFYNINVEGTVHLVGDYTVGDYAFCSTTVENVVLGVPEDDGQTLEEGFVSKRSIGEKAFAELLTLDKIEAYGAPPAAGEDAFKAGQKPWYQETDTIAAMIHYPVADFAAWDAAMFDAKTHSIYSSLIPIGRESVDRAVVLVVDTSGSMQGDPIETLRPAVSRFCSLLLSDEAQSKAKTHLALITYNSECNAYGFSPYPSTFTNRENQLTAGGGTNMYDALAMARSYLNRIDSTEKDLIVMTDGLPEHGTTLDVGPFSSEEYGSHYSHANAVYSMYCTIPQYVRTFTVGFYHDKLSDQDYKLSSKLLHLIQNSGFFEVTEFEDLAGQFDDIVYTLLSQIQTQAVITINEKETTSGSVNQVKATINIKNNDVLNAANVKAKIDLSDHESSGLELVSGQQEEIEVGDIRAGGTGTAEWVLHAPVTTSEKVYQFAVTVGGENIHPVKKYYDIIIPAASPGSDIYNTIEKNERWKFLNEEVGSYYIDSKLKNRLKKHLTNHEMEVVQKVYFDPKTVYEGSCYGMSVSAAMFKKGLMTADSWQNGAVTASDIGLSDTTRSMLTYFQVLQDDESLVNKYLYNTGAIKVVNGKKKFERKPLKTRITNLVNALEKNGCVPVGISFGGYKSDNKYAGFGHEIIAYGKPIKMDTPYTVGGVSYDMCIKTYDVNTSSSSNETSYVQDSYIYYTSDMSKLCVPYYMSSEKCMRDFRDLKNLKGELDEIIDDVSIFSEYDPEKDFAHYSAQEKNERLGIKTNSSNLKITFADKTEYIQGTDLAEELGLWTVYSRMYVPGSEGESWLNIYSAEPEESYTIQTEEDKPLDIIASYDGSASFVEGSKDAAATLAGPGQVSISDNDGEYNVKMVLDENEGFGDMVAVNGDANSNISITKESTCFKISTDDESLTDVALTIENGDESSETTLNTELNALYVSTGGSDGITVSEEMPEPATPPAPPAPSVAPAPAAPAEIMDLPAIKISKPTAAKKKITVKWKKVSKKNLKKISGIQIQVATDPGFTNIVKTATAGKKKTSKAIKGLQSKTKYYVRIRAYAAGGHVSGWKAKSVKIR